MGLPAKAGQGEGPIRHAALRRRRQHNFVIYERAASDPPCCPMPLYDANQWS